ncbi:MULTISPECIES: hypothetical protein [Streptomyces]|uniref:hypothetical protein n=1 Tax=Streptomyces TaxID=1883 RepID=UPI00163C9BA4|nr:MULTISPECIES: hypothetical protein [Streptomyces]MBC2876445.1 hypothetical protein [Streptomyces sp. TYQ1024]UBI40882.1 hypothetical protein K7I03_33390 [Streptomyces mobaraensis]
MPLRFRTADSRSLRYAAERALGDMRATVLTPLGGWGGLEQIPPPPFALDRDSARRSSP